MPTRPAPTPRQRRGGDQVTVIAVTGPSAAGKTTFAAALAALLPAAVHLQQDWFFRDPDTYPPDANFCQPRYLHGDEFTAAFTALAAGTSAVVPQIDFTTFRPCGTRTLGPARYLIVEGMTVLREAAIHARCQVRYYLNTDFATIAVRKRDRDRHERHKTAAVIEAQLAWMRTEHDADQMLRDDPGVTVLTPADIPDVLAQWAIPAAGRLRALGTSVVNSAGPGGDSPVT